jgi:hypothetical protein
MNMNIHTHPLTADKALLVNNALTHSPTHPLANTHPTRPPLALQNAGNDLYKTGKYVDSIVRYSAAIAKDPATAAFRNNRAAAHMMLQVATTPLSLCLLKF